MEQEKIGRFIAEKRKERNMTQQELGEKLGVTDKTISRWENGNYMPDLSLLKPLSIELGISINELLSGEKINKENEQEKFEENVINTIDYSAGEIKKSKLNIGIIGFGVFLLALALLFFSSNGMTALYSIVSLIIISFGIYRTRKNYKIITSVVFFISAFMLLLLMDYNRVLQGKEPIFSYLIETGDNMIVYKTPFYNAYRCNKDTISEYYEIDFSKNREMCTNIFDPNKSAIGKLLKYQNKYLGNNSNTINLYNALPLSQYGFGLELDSLNLGIIVNYSNSEFYMNEDNKDTLFVKRNLIYNAVITFLLIENVEYIDYNFLDNNYRISRKDILKYENYNKLIVSNEINESNFGMYVTEKIKDNNFVGNNFDKLFNTVKQLEE